MKKRRAWRVELVRDFTGHGTTPRVRYRWWWRVVAPNGRILCHSEQYTTKQAAKSGIRSAKQALIETMLANIVEVN